MSHPRDATIAMQFLMIRDLADSAIPLAGDQRMIDVLTEIRRMADEAQAALDHGIVSEPVDHPPRN